jgi:hypothetical protein
MMNEMIQDTMEMGEDEIDDTDVDQLIGNMQTDIKNKKQKDMEANYDAEND